MDPGVSHSFDKILRFWAQSSHVRLLVYGFSQLNLPNRTGDGLWRSAAPSKEEADIGIFSQYDGCH
jgi:hypothetical protein